MAKYLLVLLILAVAGCRDRPRDDPLYDVSVATDFPPPP